jgi:hypothetical protein
VQILNRPAAVNSVKIFEQYANHCAERRGKDAAKMEQVRRPAKMYEFRVFEE